ncbi:MAG: hypothetical protein PWP65_1846 [Clostridia bacterium]|nr:hypothetical protein [Clostridia bacterium]
MFWQRRSIPVLQLEVSGRCQLKCIFCPHTILAEKWQGRLFSWESFRKYIAPYLKGIGLIYFQGWGEPLLHPRLFDMLQAAKAAGCRVGFTTNGVLLNPEIATKIVSLPCDVLGVSLAGATEDTYILLEEFFQKRAAFANPILVMDYNLREPEEPEEPPPPPEPCRHCYKLYGI